MQLTLKQISDFYNKHPDCIGTIDAVTRHGNYPIINAGVTLRDAEYIKVSFDNDSCIEGSLYHRLFINGDWVFLRNIVVGDYGIGIGGNRIFVTDIEGKEDRLDLYDIEVETVHEYFANGIVSHNSTWLDSIVFCLFDKSYRGVNKPRLINSVNQRNCLTVCKFSIHKDKYVVSRGIKPNIFTIEKNGKLFNQTASIRDQQQFLESQILKTNFNTFCQVVMIGSASYVPFMELSPGARRGVVESLLDISVFSDMRMISKSKFNDNKAEQTITLTEISTNKKLIEAQKELISKLKNSSDSIINDHKKELKQKREKHTDVMKLVSDIIGNLSNELNVDETTNKMVDSKSIIRAYSFSKEHNEKRISFFRENDICDTCDQSIEPETKKTKIDELTSLNNKIELDKRKEEIIHKTHADNLTTMEVHNENMNEYKRKLKSYREEISQLTNDINNIEEKIKAHSSNNNSKDIDRDKLIRLEEAKRLSDKKYKTLVSEMETIKSCILLLRDDGIKADIIKTYIPIINREVNKFLQLLSFNVHFELDENFNEIFKSRFRGEFQYKNFSMGERQRINLALLFAWRSVAELKNSLNTNLLIMDEVLDQSLDSQGIDDLMNIMDELNTDVSMYVISHRDGMVDKFQNVIKFGKINEFSYIDED